MVLIYRLLPQCIEWCEPQLPYKYVLSFVIRNELHSGPVSCFPRVAPRPLALESIPGAAQLMPASAIIDSDDEPAGGGSKRNSRGRMGNGSSSGLAAVDITTPLEEDEVMPEVKPYVVSQPIARLESSLRVFLVAGGCVVCRDGSVDGSVGRSVEHECASLSGASLSQLSSCGGFEVGMTVDRYGRSVW